ncbi:HAD hydrolase-like protein [Arcticibacter eurypsychrophilus]|uniref:HAD hydrolase-like protein n=1 Tax=Arcticibacter eurypsychrophilus TaxID=1434752 RepID=UPI00084D75C1|nr:HAD hydrolase-like protein [Arcticibacter eurypsychrophilus]
MIKYSDFDPSKKAFVFELDHVLIPERDYLLQVYYLFANFLEYTETIPPSAELVEFMKKAYDNQGKQLLFEKAKEVYGFDEKYAVNFARLHREAKLPLPLLLNEGMLELLQAIVIDRKLVFIVTAGDPVQQLNKIKQTEWNGLEHYLKVYFANELKPKPAPDVLLEILNKYQLQAKDVVLVGAGQEDQVFAKNAEIDFVSV